jgi:hypothetical protein
MTDYPITPPQWQIDAWQARIETMGSDVPGVLLDIAQWGADQELEACCEYLVRCAQWEPEDVAELRAARRPKPPSLKEQALGAMGRFTTNAHTHANKMMQDFDIIRRALEQLDD